MIASGAYTVDTELQAEGIDVHGVAGQAAPLLTSSVQSEFFTLAGGTLRHVALRGTAPGEDTLVVEAGLAAVSYTHLTLPTNREV